LARTALWAAATAAMAVPLFSPGSPVSLVHVAMERPASLVITGSIDQLTPGVTADLHLMLQSNADAPTEVRSVSVRVTGATPGCSPAALSVGTWSGQLNVAARSSSAVRIPVLLGAGSRGCDAATWRLAYSST
jgi:hypothetical protein